MDELLTQVWAHGINRKLILSVVVWVAAFVLGCVLPGLAVYRLPDDRPHFYGFRKATTYAVNTLAILLTVGIWLEHGGNLSLPLGILGAGLASALQEVIGTTGVWIAELIGRPFTIDDWQGGDHNAGRLVTVSNAFIFKEPLSTISATYTTSGTESCCLSPTNPIGSQ